MSLRGTARRLYWGVLGLLRLLTRPVRKDRGLQSAVIQAYRGYGTETGVYLMGRVFRQLRFGSGLPPGSLRRAVADLARRLTRWGMGGARVKARFQGAEQTVETDLDGYFRIDMELEAEPDRRHLWHDVELEVEAKGEVVHETGSVFIPPPTARVLVISDIDDTVMHTGVANTLRMLWRQFMQPAESRTVLPGVPALYRAFHEGPSGDEHNPVLYVSRAPWSIYEVLERFFQMHGIPAGPVLFLREWGLSLQSPLPRRAREHKRKVIEGMLERYPGWPVVLIGDSGQHDPELYARIVHQQPDRIKAVYIRDVSRSRRRAEEIAHLAREVAAAGSSLLLAEDTAAMARHAAEEGFISAEHVAEVEAEAQDEP